MRGVSFIITHVVTLIAMKREVAAANSQVFRGANVKLRNWRQVTVYMLNTSTRSVEQPRESPEDTHGKVYSHRLSYSVKVRKGGDFFYGKSSNENYSESL